MLLLHQGVDSINVRRGIAPRERNPQKVIQRARGELGIVHKHDQREAIDRITARECLAKPIRRVITTLG